MKKVICIHVPNDWPHFCEQNGGTHPDVGDECIVTKETTIWCNGLPAYQLAEHGSDRDFAARNFATLPATTEEVGIEQECEAIIYQR